MAPLSFALVAHGGGEAPGPQIVTVTKLITRGGGGVRAGSGRDCFVAQPFATTHIGAEVKPRRTRRAVSTGEQRNRRQIGHFVTVTH